jgi:hypothetical protein
MPPGIAGSLLSATAFDRHLAPAVRQLRVPSPPQSRIAIGSWWNRVRRECGPATSLRAICDVVAGGLANALGFRLAGRHAISDAIWLARFEHDAGVIPLALVPWGSSLDAARRDVTRASMVARSRWAIVLNGPALRLADVGPASTRRHLDVNFELAADNERSSWCVSAIAAALRHDEGDGRCALDRLVDTADQEGRRVCAALREGVVVALERLSDAIAAGGAAPRLQDVYEDAQTAVYRLLFLAFAEARRLVPSWHPVYRGAYSIAALRAQADANDSTGLWAAFQAMSRLAHEGCEAGDLQVSPFNGRLFSPGRAPRLEKPRMADARLAEAVQAISWATVSGRRERIAYDELGVEEIGGIYESLLDYEPQWSSASAPRRARRVVLARTARATRKRTGTFYTPVPLTRYLVTQALQPLVDGAAPDRILALRVVDPAMGSGAFLVTACRYLADAYERALVRDGVATASDIADGDRARFRRLIAQRCLYGVDLNPSAVQLARVSLWLTTLAAGKPLGFLDHRLRCGDSLVGGTLADVLNRAPPRARRLPLGQGALFGPEEWQEAQRRVLPIRRVFEEKPDDTAEDVRRKEASLTELAASDAPWRRVADLWCARWARGLASRDAEFDALARHLVNGSGPLPGAIARRVLDEAAKAAGDARYLHWPLEFPEVFCDDHGRERPDGGFDAVIGNPPWEMLRADGQRGQDPRTAATMRFVRDAGVYHARSAAHANEYQLFVERAVQLARPGGRLGLVVPHGLASDHGAAPLRQLLLRECRVETIAGFENRRGVFPIHRSVRFLLVAGQRGAATTTIRCRFGVQDPAVLDGLLEREPGDAWPIVLTPALLERISGPDLAIPDVRSPGMLALVERVCARHPRLPSADGWGATFGRELNATDDRHHFVEGPAGLPIVEGKHLSPCRVDVPGTGPRIRRDVAARLLGDERRFGRPRLAFRDVASSTNRTTLIAAIVPAGCVTTHTVFCLQTRLAEDDQWTLCALLNSYVANFFVRLRVSSHVSLSIIESLPVPRVASDSAVGRRLAACARQSAISRGASEAEPLMQGLAAVAYELSLEEFDLVLEGFPLVERESLAMARDCFIREARRPGSRRGA